MHVRQKPSQRLTADQVTQLLYLHDIRSLRARLSQYLAQKQAVWILFDNLDVGWSTHGIDDIDALVLRCLINAGRAIERDMRKDGRVFHCIVLVRNDVYEHLMRSSPDYGKEMRAVLDWTDRDLLREMLRLRLVSGLEATPAASLEQVVPLICISHYGGHEVIDYMIDRSLMRPRNLLKIFIHRRGIASNFNHDRISEADLEKGLAAYSQDLLLELDRELTDVFPGGESVLYQLLDAQSELTREQLKELIVRADVDGGNVPKVIEFLMYYGVIGLRTDERDLYIYDVEYDSRKLAVRIERAGEGVRFCINPAFWPSLNIQ